MAKKARILTSGELKRKENFEAKAQELTQQGYEKKDLTISLVAANFMGIAIMLPILGLFSWLFFIFNQQNFTLNFNSATSIIFLLAIFVLIVLHELVHGIIWAIFAKEHLRSIEFGVIWTMLTPYCTCDEALTRVQYILGAMAPTVVLGVLPAIVAVICNSTGIFLISLVMILSGGGDALITLKLIFYKETRKTCIYMDHPYECGIVVFERAT